MTPSPSPALALHRALLGIGKQIAALWCFGVAVILWVSLPLAICVGAAVFGQWVSRTAGGGALVFLASTLTLGVFLAVYVWQPYVRPVAGRAAETMLKLPEL